MADKQSRMSVDDKIDALAHGVAAIAQRLDEHITITSEYRVGEESDRRAIKRDIRCLHDGYEANKTVVDSSIIEIRAKVDDINLALFAKNEDNKFEQVGMMTTARNIDKHITVVCNITKWVWRGMLAIVTSVTALVGAVKLFGVF